MFQRSLLPTSLPLAVTPCNYTTRCHNPEDIDLYIYTRVYPKVSGMAAWEREI